MRNKNMFRSTVRIKQELSDWFATQSAVGAKVTKVSDDSITLSIEDREIELVPHKNDGLEAEISVEAEALNSIIAKVSVGETLRTGTGQWTFYAEPDAQRLIFSETETFA